MGGRKAQSHESAEKQAQCDKAVKNLLCFSDLHGNCSNPQTDALKTRFVFSFPSTFAWYF